MAGISENLGLSVGVEEEFGDWVEFRPVGGSHPQGADKTAPLRANCAQAQVRYPNPEFLTPVGLHTKGISSV